MAAWLTIALSLSLSSVVIITYTEAIALESRVGLVPYPKREHVSSDVGLHAREIHRARYTLSLIPTCARAANALPAPPPYRTPRSISRLISASRWNRGEISRGWSLGNWKPSFSKISRVLKKLDGERERRCKYYRLIKEAFNSYDLVYKFINFQRISRIFSLQIDIKLCNYLICQLEKIFFELYTIFWTLPNIRIYICREKNRVYLVKSKLAWTIISREWKTGCEISAKCGLLSKLNEKREGRVWKLRHARARLLIQKEEEEEAGAADKRRLPRSEPLWPGYKRENPGPVCLRAGRGQAAARRNHVLPRARSPESFYCP